MKSEQNWSTSISALDLASHKGEPLDFNGDTSELSCFLAFMYHQKGLGLFLERPSSIVFLRCFHSTLWTARLHAFCISL